MCFVVRFVAKNDLKSTTLNIFQTHFTTFGERCAGWVNVPQSASCPGHGVVVAVHARMRVASATAAGSKSASRRTDRRSLTDHGGGTGDGTAAAAAAAVVPVRVRRRPREPD